MALQERTKLASLNFMFKLLILSFRSGSNVIVNDSMTILRLGFEIVGSKNCCRGASHVKACSNL